MADLRDKTIVVTGAGRGLGAAFAHVLADAGANLVLAGRTAETLEDTQRAIAERSGRGPDTVALDLAAPDSVAQATETILARHATIDVLVNNGAFWLSGGLADVGEADILQAIGSAVSGTLLLTRALLPGLLRSSGPDVINIVSMSGIANSPLHHASVAFYAAKHGQAGLTNGLRQELRSTPVRVVGIYPPNIEDISPLEPAWQESATRPKAAGITNRDVVEAVLFALGRPRNCTIATLVFDADEEGMYADHGSPA